MEEVAHYPYHYTDTNGHRQEEEEEDDSEAERRRRERVGRMVGEWLAAPGDLELGKLDLLRRNVQNKANTTRAQLKAMVQAQLLSASKGMELLALSHQQIRGMQLNFEELERSNERCKGLIGQYPLLKAVNDARTNLLRTLREVDKTLQIPHKIEQVRALMEDDKNLASVYNEVKAMEKLRNIALKQAVNQDAEQRHLLEKVFEGVHSLLFDFKDRVFQLIRSALPSARERPESLVQAVQVIEQEQKLYEQQKSASDVPTEASDTTILLGGDDGSSPMEACLLHLRESIADRYREVFAECGDDIQRILRRTEPLLSDLSDVMQQFINYYPATI
ncbi:Exocyst complex component Sec6 [Balamuthia mandrillaris]